MLVDSRMYDNSIRRLIYLIGNIERLNDNGYLKTVLKANKVTLIDFDTLSVIIVKEDIHRYLICKDEKLGLKEFSIRLGTGKYLINRRVINELNVKTFCAVRGISQSQHNSYLQYLFEEKILLAFNYALLNIDDNVFSRFLRPRSNVRVSKFWEFFCDDFTFDATIDMRRGLLGTYTVALTGYYRPIQLLETHYGLQVKGNKGSIYYHFHKELVKVLKG